MNNYQAYTNDAVTLLKQLIETPSFSREEGKAADILAQHIEKYGLEYQRQGNNILIKSPQFVEGKPTILLCAHIDTVKPVASWTKDPFKPIVENNEVLYGLGSNDCGGGLVSLLQAFRILITKEQPYNLIYLATAEEEISGTGGYRLIAPQLPAIDIAIVGEPTAMQPAIAEKGLMVLDITWHGKSGHAARKEGINAIYQALNDLSWLHHYRFKRNSDLLGECLLNITMLKAGTQHNVIPDRCEAVVDIRPNELYTNEEIFEFIGKHIMGEVKARSMHLQPSSISKSHPLVVKCIEMGMQPFGSPTLSDQALMSYPSIKLGPGHSSRSHVADEYILICEIDEAIQCYVELLDGFNI